jgi:uncharacterized protein (DUF1697 family)
MPRFVALLRGINVGGNKKVPMATLKKTAEKLGFTDVKTLLASGNLIFTTSTSEKTLRALLEKTLAATFKFPIPVIIRSATDIETLIAADPFKGITVDENTRLYVTFLGTPPAKHPAIPAINGFRVVRAKGSDVCSVLQLNPAHRTPEAMNGLEQAYGKDVTTRNWNTVLKLLA